VIAIRRARVGEAAGIASVHVLTWRSAYAGILPDEFLSKLSLARLTIQYERAIRTGLGVHVASHASPFSGPAIVGFSTARRVPPGGPGDGEVETLYVLDDWQDRGLGGQLLRASAKHLAALGCSSAFAWVLRDNPSGYFYRRLGGRRIADGTTHVGGQAIPQTAYAWDPITTLLDVDA
jgi:ribosomal protein S18 acetylase RimI-like enzyme